MLLLSLLACAHLPSPAPAPYAVAVAEGSSGRMVAAVYHLEVSEAPGDAVTFRTVRSEGSWEEGGEAHAWDSDAPAGSTPWALTLQHAIASVPTPVTLVDGRPTGLVDADAWRANVAEVLASSDLPIAALRAASGLIEPEGVLADLQRSFPGLPSPTWTRQGAVAGVGATREETCTRSRSGGRTTWECAGQFTAPPGSPAGLRDVRCTARVVADRRGLVAYESGFDGVLVLLGPDGQPAAERAVAGRRLVERQNQPRSSE